MGKIDGSVSASFTWPKTAPGRRKDTENSSDNSEMTVNTITYTGRLSDLRIILQQPPSRVSPVTNLLNMQKKIEAIDITSLMQPPNTARTGMWRNRTVFPFNARHLMRFLYLFQIEKSIQHLERYRRISAERISEFSIEICQAIERSGWKQVQ